MYHVLDLELRKCCQEECGEQLLRVFMGDGGGEGLHQVMAAITNEGLHFVPLHWFGYNVINCSM